MIANRAGTLVHSVLWCISSVMAYIRKSVVSVVICSHFCWRDHADSEKRRSFSWCLGRITLAFWRQTFWAFRLRECDVTFPLPPAPRAVETNQTLELRNAYIPQRNHVELFINSRDYWIILIWHCINMYVRIYVLVNWAISYLHSLLWIFDH